MTDRLIICDYYWTRDKDPRVPLGHASLLASLQARVQADIVSVCQPVNTCADSEQFVAELLRLGADSSSRGQVAVAFGVYVWNELVVCRTIEELRRRGFDGDIILGGPQISYHRGGLERSYPGASVFVRGYGEDALVALITSPEHPLIRGVHRAGSADLLQQASVELERLPSPFLGGLIRPASGEFQRWETQRGCPFRCSFCQHREAGDRLRRRELDPGRIRDEIDMFCRAGVGEIAVLDPIFNIGNHGCSVLERFVSNGFAGRLSLQCRAESASAVFIEAAAQLDVCLEFGLQTLHEAEGRAIQRRNNIAKVDAALEEVRRQNVDHEVTLIFGLPLQTYASFAASVQWCLDRQVPVVKAFPLLLLRGTELHAQRQVWDLKVAPGPMGMVVSSCSFNEDDWHKMSCLSDALALTEGRHPESVAELEVLAAELNPDAARWQPCDSAG